MKLRHVILVGLLIGASQVIAYSVGYNAGRDDAYEAAWHELAQAVRDQ